MVLHYYVMFVCGAIKDSGSFWSVLRPFLSVYTVRISESIKVRGVCAHIFLLWNEPSKVSLTASILQAKLPQPDRKYLTNTRMVRSSQLTLGQIPHFC